MRTFIESSLSPARPDDPKLAAEFRAKLESDEAFRGSSRARLQWFYQRTPFYDERARLYPVGREVR